MVWVLFFTLSTFCPSQDWRVTRHDASFKSLFKVHLAGRLAVGEAQS
jgi:hypothetical protein